MTPSLSISIATPTPIPINYTSSLIPFRTISKRQQWLANFGYCGELSFIASAMYYGMYMSQYDVRYYTSPTHTQKAQGDQVLINAGSDIAAAELFKFSYERWIDLAQPAVKDTTAFLTWMQGHTTQSHPLVSVMFENTATLAGVGSQDEYDHVVSIISVSPTSITFCDDGIITPSSGEHVFNSSNEDMIFTYALPQAIRNRADALASGSEYSIPSIYPTYINAGIALTGINSTEPNLVRIQLTTPDEEIAGMIEGSNARPAANPMTFTIHLYGLQPSTTYYLYQYKDPALVPTNHFNQTYQVNSGGGMIIRTVITTTASPAIDTTVVQTLLSSDIAIFRCVPSTAL
jgi:hypothetical protein